MSVTVELSEQDAFLWDAFRRGGEWVAASEYRKLMAQNAKLREELESVGTAAYLYGRSDLKVENDKLRELVRDMWRDGMCECDERGACAQCEYHFPDRMRDLGVEVDE